MQTETELLAKQTAELAAFRRKKAFAEAWADPVKHICLHDKYLSATYAKDFPSRYSLAEAVEIFNRIRARFELVTAEHWKDGCVSCFPPEINSNATKERATLIGSSVAEITIAAGRGYSSHQLSFWVRVPDFGLVNVCVELQPKHTWLPGIVSRQNTHGDYTEWRVSFRSIGEDSNVGWWSPEGSYRRGYYWTDAPNFEAWTSHELATA